MRHLNAAASALLALTLSACGGGGGDGGDDSDDLPIELRIDDAQIAESAGELHFPLTLSRALGSELTIAVTATADSATAGEDYAAVPSSLTIPAGVTSTSLAVSLIDDTVVEASERFTVTLSDPTQSITNQTLSATGTIDDDDELHVSVAAASALESGDGELHFAVSLSAAAQRDISLEYASADGSAAAASDYSAASGSLQIAAGDTAAQIDIALLDDFELESAETLSLHISSADSQVLVDTANVTGTIEDDESLPLDVALLDASAAEDSGELRFTARLSRATPNAQRIDFASSADGSATNDDFTATSGTLEIPAGERDGSIAVAITADALLEADETLSVTLSNPRGELQIATASAIGTIANDDTARLELGDASVTEGGLLRFTASLQPAAAIDVAADYATADATTSGDDYSAASGRINLPAGASSAIIEVQTGDDALLENDEQLRLALSAPSAGLVLGDAAIGTIVNDDSVQLSVADARVGEGDSGSRDLDFAVQLVGDSAIAVSFEYATGDATSGNPATADSDYNSASGRVEFAPGERQASIGVAINGDEIVEPSETFELRFASASAGLELPAAPALGSIDNDDGAILSAADLSQGEDDGTLTFVLTLNKAAEIDLEFTAATADGEGSAAAGSDYDALNAQLYRIPAGQTRIDIPVQVSADTLVEHDEQFYLQLSAPSLGLILERERIAATLENDDSLSVSLTDAAASEDSDEPLSFAVRLDQAAGYELRFEVATSDGTTSADSDYSAPPAQLLIPAGRTRAQITVDAIADAVLEADEYFRLNLTPAEGQSGVNAASAIGTLRNDDSVTLSIDAAPPTAEGGDAPLRFTLSLDAAAGVPVALRYDTLAASATPGVDFTSVGADIEIPVGQTEVSVEVPLLDDDRVEGSERLRLAVSSATSGVQVAASPVAGEIADDDSVSIAIASASATEAKGELVFIVELGDSADIDLDIGYRSLDPAAGDAATAGDDYTAVDTRLTIPAGQDTAEIRIAVVDDALVERDERLDVELYEPATGISLGTAQASGSIVNDDSYSIEVSDAGADENTGTLDFVVNLSQIALDQLTLRYSSSDGSATAGSDYTAASAQTTSIPAGSDSATLSLALIDDSDYESSEDLNLRVDLLGIDGSVASSVDASGVIRDDDTVAISTSDMIALEGVRDHVTVSVRIATAAPVLVDYATEDFTASDGSDYTEVSGTLDFNGGITELSVEIPILDDDLLEGNERFLLRLSNPSANAALAVEAATVTIDDNDGGELNDTGVMLCGNADDNELPCDDTAENTAAYPGQDAEQGRDVLFDDDSDGRAGFSFTKLDDDGDPLSADASSWNCVYDNVTGLTWEAKQDNGLHDADDTFSWYNPRSSQNGGGAGTRDGGNCDINNCDTEGFVDAVNAAELCGYDDWRLPTPMELRSLADMSTSRFNMPAIDGDYFPGSDHGYRATSANWRYWTGIPQVSSPVNHAWTIAFDDGHETPGPKSDDYHLRLVRD